jgi:hypothetical protein
MVDGPVPSKIPPYLVAALICDVGATDRATGKKSLIGIYSALFAGVFPTTRPVTLYLKLTDAEGFYPLRVEFLSSKDGLVLVTANGSITCRSRTESEDLLMDFPPVPFPSAGRYEFRILMSDMYVGCAVLDAAEIPA